MPSGPREAHEGAAPGQELHKGQADEEEDACLLDGELEGGERVSAPESAGGIRYHRADDGRVPDDGHGADEDAASEAERLGVVLRYGGGAEPRAEGRERAEDYVGQAVAAEEVGEGAAYPEAPGAHRHDGRQYAESLRNAELHGPEGDGREQYGQRAVGGADDRGEGEISRCEFHGDNLPF